MTKKLITAVLLSLIVVLLIGTTAFADTMEEQNVEEQIVEELQEEVIIPEDDVDVISVQGVPVVAVDNVETEEITENEPDGSSGGNYYIKFTQTTDDGEKTCQFYGGSEEGISVRDILNALQLGYDITESTVIDVVEDSVDTNVIGVRRTDTDIFITDQGMFSKAEKDLVITVNGEEIALSVFDDIRKLVSSDYLFPVYIDNDVTKGIQKWETGNVRAEKVSAFSVNWGAKGKSTWYAVTENVTLSGGVICEGTVNLILCDGTCLEVTATINNAGILVSGDNSLIIYAQSTGDTEGKLVAIGGDSAAGIGGGDWSAGNNITINGGAVTAAGGIYGAGIGGGDGGSGNNITINGGIVTAIGGDSAAGIGGGDWSAGNNITINGGAVTATSGEWAAGIGGGFYGNADGIVFNGGTVTATGGNYGAGIGGGDYGAGNNITINGGTVTAAGGIYGAGIGGGDWSAGNNITINGGAVTAAGGIYGAGIGGGRDGNANNVIVSGALVVFAGTNFSLEEMKTISHDDDTDLSKIYDFNSKRCVRIQPESEYSSATESLFRVIVVRLDSLSAAQQEAIKRFVKEHGVEIINVLKVINNGGPINKDQEKVDIPINLKELGVDSKIDIKDLRIFQLNENNTLSEVPFTQGQDNRTLGVKVHPEALPFIIIAMKK